MTINGETQSFSGKEESHMSESRLDPIAQALLDNTETGDILVDPREGIYENAVLSDAQVIQNQSGSFAIVTEFGPLTAKDGQEFNFSHRVNIATPDSDPVVQRMFLAFLHDVQVLPTDYRNAVYATTDEQRESVASAVRERRGSVFGLRLKTDKLGFLKGQIQRSRVAR